MALSVANIIEVAKVSEYLAANDVSRGTLFGQKAKPAPNTARIIYMERKALEYMYDRDPTDTTLQKTANYVYALCNKYVLQAQVIVNGSSGGGGTVVVPGGTPSSWLQYSYYVTADDVANDFIFLPSLFNAEIRLLNMSGISREFWNNMSDYPIFQPRTETDSFVFHSSTALLYYMITNGLVEGTWLQIFYTTD